MDNWAGIVLGVPLDRTQQTVPLDPESPTEEGGGGLGSCIQPQEAGPGVSWTVSISI